MFLSNLSLGNSINQTHLVSYLLHRSCSAASPSSTLRCSTCCPPSNFLVPLPTRHDPLKRSSSSYDNMFGSYMNHPQRAFHGILHSVVKHLKRHESTYIHEPKSGNECVALQVLVSGSLGAV